MMPRRLFPLIYVCMCCAVTLATDAAARTFFVEGAAPAGSRDPKQATELAQQDARRELAKAVADAFESPSLLLREGIEGGLAAMRIQERWGPETDPPTGRTLTLTVDLDLETLRPLACAAVQKRWDTRAVLVAPHAHLVASLERACIATTHAPQGTRVVDAVAAARAPYVVADEGDARHMATDLIDTSTGLVVHRLAIPHIGALEQLDWRVGHFATTIGLAYVSAEQRAMRAPDEKRTAAAPTVVRVRDVPSAAVEDTVRALLRGRGGVTVKPVDRATGSFAVQGVDPLELADLLSEAGAHGRPLAAVAGPDGTGPVDVAPAPAAGPLVRVTTWGQAPVVQGDDQRSREEAEARAMTSAVLAGVDAAFAASPDATRPRWLPAWLAAAGIGKVHRLLSVVGRHSVRFRASATALS